VKAGAKVIISARREEKLHELAAECRAHGYEPFVQPLDVTDSEKLAATVDNIVHKFGRIDSVVLNAGRSQRAIAVETSLDETKQLLDLNFISYVALTKQVLPHMIKQGSGQLVVVSSLSGRIATPIASSYSATKFALASIFLHSQIALL
jgi:dehydrogenase/reductase SDR family protein 7B